MKKLCLIFSLTLCVILGQLFLFNSKLSADVGVPPVPGGVITPGDKTEKIEMAREKVVFDIKEDDENSPFYQEAYYEGVDYHSWLGVWHYAHVTTEFDMRNVSLTEVDMELMFPIPSNLIYEDNLDIWRDHFDPDRVTNRALNFQVVVNGESKDYEYDAYKIDYEYDAYGIGGNEAADFYTIGIKFPVTFGADAVTKITIEYDADLAIYMKSIYGLFEYVLETGSHWKGSIGSGEIVFNFPDDIIEAFLLSYNDELELSGNKLIWEFTDLEPDSDHNINIRYCPYLVKVWEEREEYMEDIFSSSNATYTVQFYLGYKNDWVHLLEGNPVHLLQSQPEQGGDRFNRWLENWWIVELEDKKAPWVQFEFDAVYEVDAIRITSGILHDEDGTIHNLVSRPKKVKLVFSDGSSKELDLTDSPGEELLLEFDKVETSSVKVEVLSTYPDYEEKHEYLGIEVLNFNVGQKTGEKVANLDLTFPEEFLTENSTTTRIDTMTLEELKSVESFTLEVVGKNKVVFADTLDLSGYEALTKLQDLAEYVDFSEVGKVRIDTDYLDVFNAGATVTMYGLSFDEEPIIYKDGKVATSDEVSNIEYDKDSGILTFDVSAFSTYEAREKVAAIEKSPVKDSSLLITFVLIALVTMGGIAVVLVYRRREINFSALKRMLGFGSKEKEDVGEVDEVRKETTSKIEPTES